LLASSTMRRVMLLFIFIYWPIHVKIMSISLMYIYLKLNSNKVFTLNLVSHYFLAN
jgi:hypothetical protein